MPDPLLTPIEVATLLRLDVRTVYQLATDGTLAPTYKLGHRTLRIPQSTVDTYLDEREQPPCK